MIIDTGETPKIFTKNGFRCVKAYKITKRFYDSYFTPGSNFLDEAERLWEKGDFQAVALSLYYGTLFLLRTLETVFYGNHIAAENIWRSFKRAAHFSTELLDEFPPPDNESTLFFQELDSLRRIPYCRPPLLTTKKYKLYLRRLRTMQQIVKSCSESHLAYLQSRIPGNETPLQQE